MTAQKGLFDSAADAARPLADRMRPRTVDEFIGQDHILGPGKPLRTAIEAGRAHSMIFWGPPGTGKTTLGRLVATHANACFLSLSAVLSGVKEIREVIAEAKRRRAEHGEDCVLFVDEAHRFNKSQQDAFLPHVENGTVIFIGATTENPSFELNNALLSRARVYVLEALGEDAIEAVVDRALSDADRGLGARRLEMAPELRRMLAGAVDGDARRALNLLEIAADLVVEGAHTLTEEVLLRVLQGGSGRRFDKGGDAFYDQISALHKSIRGSNPDGALYWLARMIDGGADPRYLARRLVRIASEDIGNADPRALTLGTRCMGRPGAARQSRGGARACARCRLHGVRPEEQRGLRRIRRGDARCARARLPGGAEAPPQCPHPAAGVARARRGLSLRARRARRLRGRRAVPA